MRTLNLGILAHVDAGKTTLTERLLFAAGVISEIGSVDAGTTQTDSLELERRRGITIKAAVVSFVVDDVTVNLIDTPGHPDFIAEVERSLGVLDGVVLVVSAVEGVQAQTRVLMRTLQRLRLPTLFFLNKVDRVGADCERTLAAIKERLTPQTVAMTSVAATGTRDATAAMRNADEAFVAELCEVLAVADDSLLHAYISDGERMPWSQLQEALARQSQQALVHPAFSGSAITGAGVGELMAAIPVLLPAGEPDPAATLSASIFKIDRGPSGEKIAYVRVFAGSIHVRDQVHLDGGRADKVTAITVFDHGRDHATTSLPAGRIGKVWGLKSARIGDTIGPAPPTATGRDFPPPTLETAVVAVSASDKGRLRVALDQLAEQDPLINVRQDDIRQELYLSLYGEVQKEVIEATLADVGIAVAFRTTTPICIERPARPGRAVELLGKTHPFTATLGFDIAPGPPGSGVQFDMEVDVGDIPMLVYKSVDAFGESMYEYVTASLAQGLHGWPVTDCKVILSACDHTPGSIAADFRKLTPLVVMGALRRAGTTVCEPVHRFHLDAPADTLNAVLKLVTQSGAIPHTTVVEGNTVVVEGHIPAARMHELQHGLRGATRGEGLAEFTLDRYEPVRGPVPRRPRTDHNPLNRKEYLLHVRGRSPGKTGGER